jgi:hypothetical protein
MPAVHPTSHNLLVAYKDSNFGVRLATVRASDGQILSDFLADTGPMGQAGDCGVNSPNDAYIPKCGGSTSTDCGGKGCMRMADNVYLSVAQQPPGGTNPVYAYLSFTYRCGNNGPDGRRHLKAVVRVVNVSNDAAPVNLLYKQGTPCNGYNDNEFEPVALALAGPTFRFAWAYYRQYLGDPCNTLLMPWTATDPLLTTLTNLGSMAVSLGPSLRIGANSNFIVADIGLGDYISGDIMPNGDSYGFYFAYTRQVNLGTSPSCPGNGTGKVMCQGNYRSLGLSGVFVSP